MSCYLREELYALIKKDNLIFDFIQEDTLDGLWFWDLEQPEHGYLNTRLWKILGYNSVEIPEGAESWKLVIKTENLIHIINQFRNHLSHSPQNFSEVIRFKHKNGDCISMQLRAFAIKNEAGEQNRMLGALQNITEAELANKEIVENQKRYKSLFVDSPIPLWEEDFSEVKKYVDQLKNEEIDDFETYFKNNPDKVAACSQLIKIVDVNNATLALHDAESKEELLKGLHLIFTEKSYEAFTKELVAIAKGETECEFEGTVKTLKGNEIHVNLRWLVVPGYEDTLEKVYISTSDITERIKAEQLIRESEEKLRLTIDNSPLGVAAVGLDGKFVSANSAFETITGYALKELNELTLFELTHPDDRADNYQLFDDLIQKKTDRFTYEKRYLRKDGAIINVHINAGLVFDKEDKPKLALAFIEDITDKKAAEQKLEKLYADLIISKERLSVAIEGGNIGTWELNLKTKEIITNDYWIRSLGYTAEEVEPTLSWWISHYHPDDIKASKTKMADYIAGRSTNYSTELRTKTKAGQWIWVHDKAQIVAWDTDGKPLKLSGVHIDISERKLHEEKIAKQNNDLHSLNKALSDINKQLNIAKNNIEEERKRYQSIFDHSSSVMLIIDPDNGQIVDANQAACNYYQYPYADITQMGINKINVLSEKEVNIEIEKAKNKNQTFFNFRHKRADGTVRDVEVYSGKIEIEQKTFLHSIVHDVTDRKALELKNAMLSKAVESSPIAVIITSTEGDIEYVNPAFEKMTGYTSAEVLGLNPALLDSANHSQVVYKDLWQNLLDGKSWQSDIQNKRKNGELYWVNAAISPVLNYTEKIVQYVIVQEDITQLKNTLTNLKHAKEQAEEANQLKTEFLHNMSHEIRTPMNGIMGFSNLLEEPDITNEKRNYFTKIIRNSCNQLVRVIDDILEISILETKKQKLVNTSFVLNDFMMEIFSIFSLKAKEQRLPLYIKKERPDNQSVIVCDKTKLNKIMSNLLENALKFTSEGYIELGYTIENHNLVLYVKDTGIGISKKNLNRIFNRFSQENKTIAESHGGLGLGLSIAKENAQLLGGDISVTSEKGKGTTFWVKLPYTPGTETRLTRQNRKAGKIGYNILVAEDEEINFLYVETLLSNAKEEKFNVIHAKNGQEAIDICATNPNIDLVLMDIKMPFVNGYEATQKIKERNPDLPVIALTAFSTETDKKLALEHGCNDFISKPVNKNTLLSLIGESLLG